MKSFYYKRIETTEIKAKTRDLADEAMLSGECIDGVESVEEISVDTYRIDREAGQISLSVH